MTTDDVWRCPICGKPFDKRDELVDFAVAAHERGHATMDPGRLLRRETGTGLWCCRICGHPFGESEQMSRLEMISHMTTHGARPTVAGQRRKTASHRGSPKPESRSLGEVIGDAIEGVIEGIGSAIEKIVD